MAVLHLRVACEWAACASPMTLPICRCVLCAPPQDPNAKYLALDSLARLAGAMPEVLEGVRHHQATVMASLKVGGGGGAGGGRGAGRGGGNIPVRKV